MAVTMLPEPASGWTSSSTTFGTVGRRRLSSRPIRQSVRLRTSTGPSRSFLEHTKEIEAYLVDQDRRYEEFKASHPLPADMIERFERGKRERCEKRG
jgi:hypothetical protein